MAKDPTSLTWEDTVSLPALDEPTGELHDDEKLGNGIIDVEGLRKIRTEALKVTKEAAVTVVSFAGYAKRLAPMMLKARLHFRTGITAARPIGQPDWAGRTSDYRRFFPSIIIEAGIPGSLKDEGSPAGRLAKAVAYQVSVLVDQAELKSATEKAVKSGRLQKVREKAEAAAQKKAERDVKAHTDLAGTEEKATWVAERVAETVKAAEDALVSDLAYKEKVAHGRAQDREAGTKAQVRADPAKLAESIFDQSTRLNSLFASGQLHDLPAEAMVKLCGTIGSAMDQLEQALTAGQAHVKAASEAGAEAPEPELAEASA